MQDQVVSALIGEQGIVFEARELPCPSGFSNPGWSQLRAALINRPVTGQDEEHHQTTVDATTGCHIRSIFPTSRPQSDWLLGGSSRHPHCFALFWQAKSPLFHPSSLCDLAPSLHYTAIKLLGDLLSVSRVGSHMHNGPFGFGSFHDSIHCLNLFHHQPWAEKEPNQPAEVLIKE